MNRNIRARIHESAVKRVTRIYAATAAEILAEILQNSRRAGATRVHIAVAAHAAHPAAIAAGTGETPLTVTIADDGAGIADPAVLLSFGENGWDDALVRREDAAGFGFASLARRNCAVSSRPRSPNGEILLGWRVELVPEHFLGEVDAEVRADEDAHRSRMERRFRSRRRSPPPRSATRPRTPPGTTRCRSMFEDRHRRR